MSNKLTTIEATILKAVNSRPNDWLIHHHAYLGDVLALQAKGYVTTRISNGYLQVRAVSKCERCESEVSEGSYCDDCLALSNNEFYSHFAALALIDIDCSRHKHGGSLG